MTSTLSCSSARSGVAVSDFIDSVSRGVAQETRPQGPAILPGRAHLDMRPAQPSAAPAGKIDRGGTPVKFGQIPLRWKFEGNRGPSGANTMNDTRALLNRV